MKTDETLQKDVMSELRWEPVLNAAEIGVAVKNGVVTLTGEVNNYLMKMAAERAAKRVTGVMVVAQEITVKPIDSEQHGDEQIGQAIIRSFGWHSQVPQDLIQVKVQHGWVTLEGEVEWNYQLQAAERAVETISGVKGVSNLIRVKPQVIAQDVNAKIIDALKRNAVVEAQQIKVETNGNKVTLRGKVHSWAERKEVENAAWAAPGVMAVEDDLVVTTY
ncbi:BON domain-containing protein [Spirosoma aureum]|uniref:BON domain-containing protein n=1 Tax=Spirosoma aureum TaxID=2692134 RepID=A0A6G9ARU3_9BACT|nr:BON domain-containing protein [Spirosoma aureum]QIP15130.1 BON domain-containing protein [Spirosoma aureum]